VISFCVKSYNQRRYLRAALEGAMAQTYRPLEIVVSDDCSTDGSWDEIRSFFASHPAPDGVTLVLNRNAENLGSLGNWEKLCSLAHGELIVKADGDDVSLPERTARIVEAWAADGKRAKAICHSGWEIGTDGGRQGRLRQVRALWPLGAAMAFSPEIFRTFGFTDDGTLVDDELYSRRALMLGTVLEIPDRLVEYRIGSGATTDRWNIRRLVTGCTDMSLRAIRRALRDLAALPDDSLGSPRDELEKTFSGEVRFYAHKAELLSSPDFRGRLRAYRALAPHRLDIAGYQQLAFLMPRPVGDTMLLAYALARNVQRWIG